MAKDVCGVPSCSAPLLHRYSAGKPHFYLSSRANPRKHLSIVSFTRYCSAQSSTPVRVSLIERHPHFVSLLAAFGFSTPSVQQLLRCGLPLNLKAVALTKPLGKFSQQILHWLSPTVVDFEPKLSAEPGTCEFIYSLNTWRKWEATEYGLALLLSGAQGCL